MLERLPRQFFLGVGVFSLVTLLVVISKRYYESAQVNPAMVKMGASLLKSSAELAYGAQQVKNPILALTQANYARAYLNIAKAVAPEGELSQAAQMSIGDLSDDIEREEIAAKERVLQLCPQVADKTRLAKTTGWAPPTDTPTPTPQGGAPPQSQFTTL